MQWRAVLVVERNGRKFQVQLVVVLSGNIWLLTSLKSGSCSIMLFSVLWALPSAMHAVNKTTRFRIPVILDDILAMIPS